MKVRIYKQSKSAMQSGKQNAKKWILKPIEEENIRSINSLMGWVSADSTISQLKFEFENKEDAIKFAEEKKFEYEIVEPKKPTIKPKSYAANFTK